MAESVSHTPPPLPSEQRKRIKELDQVAMRVGDVYYLVNCRWWALWKQYVGWDRSGTAEETGRPEPGPIDNEELLEKLDDESDDAEATLKANLVESFHYMLLSTRQWELLREW